MATQSVKNQKNRPDLTGEHRLGDTGQLILLFLFLGVWISDAFWLHYSKPLFENTPTLIRMSGSALILFLGTFLARKSLNIVFGEVRETPGVITKGPFGKMRHPVYVSSILLYAGLLFIQTTLASILVFAIVIVFYYLISRHEEQLLLNRFGQDYANYMKQVPMWIPYKKAKR